MPVVGVHNIRLPAQKAGGLQERNRKRSILAAVQSWVPVINRGIMVEHLAVQEVCF